MSRFVGYRLSRGRPQRLLVAGRSAGSAVMLVDRPQAPST
jgi:hypothetical protein